MTNLYVRLVGTGSCLGLPLCTVSPEDTGLMVGTALVGWGKETLEGLISKEEVDPAKYVIVLQQGQETDVLEKYLKNCGYTVEKTDVPANIKEAGENMFLHTLYALGLPTTVELEDFVENAEVQYKTLNKRILQEVFLNPKLLPYVRKVSYSAYVTYHLEVLKKLNNLYPNLLSELYSMEKEGVSEC